MIKTVHFQIKKMTWGFIRTTLAPVIQKVIEAKFLDPKLNSKDIKDHYDSLSKQVEDAFAAIVDA